MDINDPIGTLLFLKLDFDTMAQLGSCWCPSLGIKEGQHVIALSSYQIQPETFGAFYSLVLHFLSLATRYY